MITFFFFLLLSPVALSLSISPPRFVIEVLPGSSLEKTVLISTLEAESNIMYVTIEGEGAQWIQHPPQLPLNNKERVKSTLTVHIPSTAALGNYSPTINYLIPGEKNVDLAFSVPVSLRITNKEHIDYALRNLRADHNGNLSFSFTLYNQGNADFGPAEATIRVMDNLKEKTVYEGTHLINAITAFTTTPVSLNFGTALPKGNYWIDFSIPSYNYKEAIFLEVEQGGKITNTDAPVRSPFLIPLLIVKLTIILFGVVYIQNRRSKKRS